MFFGEDFCVLHISKAGKGLPDVFGLRVYLRLVDFSYTACGTGRYTCTYWFVWALY